MFGKPILDTSFGLLNFYSMLNVSAYFGLYLYLFLQLKKESLFCPITQSGYNFCKRSMLNGKDNKAALIVFTVLEVFFICSIQFYPGIFLNEIVGKPFGVTTEMYYGFLILEPFAFITGCYLLQIKPFRFLDIAAPGYAIILCFFKIACYFAGCCYGKQWENGMFNHSCDEKQYPVQLFELFFAVIIAVLLICIKKKMRRGAVHPLYIILYSATRFGTEFFRGDYEIIYNGLNLNHLICAFCFVYGIILFIFMFFKGEAIDNWLFEHNILHIKNKETIVQEKQSSNKI